MRQVSLQQIYLLLTRQCNLECTHCIRSSGPSVSDVMSLQDAVFAINMLSTDWTSATLVFSGGEPCLHKDFVELVALAATRFPNVSVDTNGQFSKPLQTVISRNPSVVIQISLDGDREAHDAIRGTGTFARAVKTIETLSEAGATVHVATTVNRANVTSLERLGRRISAIGPKNWTIRREVVFGRALQANALTTEEWNNALAALPCFLGSTRIQAAQMFAPTAFAGAALFVGQRNCGTGTSRVYVNPDLSIFPCACMDDLLLGNLRELKKEGMIMALASLDLGPRENTVCRRCPILAQCAGGCPGASRTEFGDFGFGDPRCPAVQHFGGLPC
jgi:radical SAM protein with 4Fe4S-binding SPASM domain